MLKLCLFSTDLSLMMLLKRMLIKKTACTAHAQYTCRLGPRDTSGAAVTRHDKGDTRREGEMYLPTMKVRASLRMKGMSE